jgi:hypothetical protein
VPQNNVVMTAKINKLLRPKCSCIVSNDLPRTTKMGQNVIFKKFNNHSVSGLPTWYSLDPFGEEVSGSENPLMLARRWRVYLSNEIESPLLERSLN